MPSGVHRLPTPNQPQIALHSFVLGFVVGCVVVYVLHNVVCGEEGCSYDQKEILVQVDAITSTSRIYDTEHLGVDEGGHNLTRRGGLYQKMSVSKRRRSEGIPEAKDAVNLHTNLDAMMIKSTKSYTSPSETGCPSRPLHLIILVLSSPGGIIRRNAIRGTWLHNYHHSGELKVTSRFLIGTNALFTERIGNLTVEQNQFGDLLFFDDLKDSYSNLSAKVLLGLQWAYETKNFDFLIKTDDDSYVRIDHVAKNLREMNCNDRLYWGYFMGHALPEPSGKWAEFNWFNCPHYLPYAMGGGYILSSRVIAMVMQFSYRLRLYNNEDVTVGSWLAPFNLVRKHDIRFDVESLSHGCNNHYIITHKERVRSLYEKYTNLLKNGTICDVEKEVRPAYNYNWDVAPIDCCVRTKGLNVHR